MSHIRHRRGRHLLLLLVSGSLGIVAPLAAQTPVANPTHLSFTASTDHDRLVDTVAVLDRYQIVVLAGTPTGSVVLTRSLQKPTPDAQTRVIDLAVPDLASPPAGTYYLRLEAVGPGGTTAATPIPFLVIPAPTAPLAPAVRRSP